MSKFVDGGDIDLDKEEIYLKDGTRLTEKVAEELAGDALEQVRAGRPSLTGTGKHSPHVSFRVPDDVREAVQQLADAEGVSVSKIARKALDEYLAKH